jgi:hypothetical protein
MSDLFIHSVSGVKSVDVVPIFLGRWMSEFFIFLIEMNDEVLRCILDTDSKTNYPISSMFWTGLSLLLEMDQLPARCQCAKI